HRVSHAVLLSPRTPSPLRWLAADILVCVGSDGGSPVFREYDHRLYPSGDPLRRSGSGHAVRRQQVAAIPEASADAHPWFCRKRNSVRRTADVPETILTPPRLRNPTDVGHITVMVNPFSVKSEHIRNLRSCSNRRWHIDCVPRGMKLRIRRERNNEEKLDQQTEHSNNSYPCCRDCTLSRRRTSGRHASGKRAMEIRS